MPVPRVSVITNVRNGAETLSDAIESVLGQTFTDWEMILWDNCSTDGTPAVASRYSDPRIRYFRSPVETLLSQARDSAVRKARGEWVAFLDHDDVWLPHKLQAQMALADDDPEVGLIYGRTVAVSPGRLSRDFDHRHEYAPLPEGDIFERLFVDSCFIAMSSVVIRKSALDELGPIPTAIDIVPDYYFYTFVARRHRARAVQGVVCRYLVHPHGLTGTRFRQCHEEVLWILGAHRADLDPELFARRMRVHQTLIAMEDLRSLRTFGAGLARLLEHGSVPYLLSRPFARGYRAVKRRIVPPYWLRMDPAAGALRAGSK